MYSVYYCRHRRYI